VKIDSSDSNKPAEVMNLFTKIVAQDKVIMVRNMDESQTAEDAMLGPYDVSTAIRESINEECNDSP